MQEKLILDPCCGSRMLWFDKTNSLAIYGDIRNESHTLCDGRKLKINPDRQMDFKDLPYEDNKFSLVVFDPPHLVRAGQSSWLAKKYGVLPRDWQNEIRDGFYECMRVLKPYGVLIFKWNEAQIKTRDILEAIPFKPLFGHTTKNGGHTIWMTFMKLENHETNNQE